MSAQLILSEVDRLRYHTFCNQETPEERFHTAHIPPPPPHGGVSQPLALPSNKLEN